MLPLLALASLVITPTVGFTSDSVYKNENILIIEVRENYEEDVLVSKDLLLKEKNLLGYTIYDNPDTEYIDGLKFDGSWVYDWTIKDYDDTVAHTFTVKTIYTDDVAGMLMAAKNGDWSIALSNPLIIFQLVYYTLAAISIILGGFGLLKSKKKKIKDHDIIANAVDTHAAASADALKLLASNLITEIVTPAFEKLNTQNQAIIEALILAQSGDKDSKLALINLLKSTASDDITLLSEAMKKTIEEADLTKQKIKAEADKLVEEISEGNFDGASTEDVGGIHI